MKLNRKKNNAMKTNRLNNFLLLLAAGSLPAVVAQATDGTWITTWTQGNPNSFSDANNWKDGVVADGGIMYLEALTGHVTVNIGNPTLSGITGLAGNWGDRQFMMGRATGASRLTLVASGGIAPAIDLGAVANNARLRLNAPLTANNGLRFIGNGSGTQSIILSPVGTNSVSGGVEVSGIALSLAESMESSLGSSQTVTLSGNNSRLIKAKAGAETWGNNIVLNSKTAGLELGSTGALTLNGTISEASGSRSNLVYSATVGGHSFVVNGSNSYTGDTVIGKAERVFVRINNGEALGTGTSTVSFGNEQSALELDAAGRSSTGFTVTGKTLILGGAGSPGKGQLINYSGNNIWDGDVEIEAGKSAHVGVFHYSGQATTLTIAGRISDEATSEGLFKKSTAILRLTGDNTYGSGTTIEEGWIYAGSNSALGTGDLTIMGSGGLRIEAGVNLAGVSALNLNSGSRIAFDVSGGVTSPMLVTASQVGDGSYVINLINSELLGIGSYVLMSVTGSYEASGFVLGDATFAENLIGELQWAGGNLNLHVRAIPEPASAVALLGCAAVGAGLALRGTRRKGARLSVTNN